MLRGASRPHHAAPGAAVQPPAGAAPLSAAPPAAIGGSTERPGRPRRCLEASAGAGDAAEPAGLRSPAGLAGGARSGATAAAAMELAPRPEAAARCAPGQEPRKAE